MKLCYLIAFLIAMRCFLVALPDSALVESLLAEPESAREAYEAGQFDALGESVSEAVYRSLKEGRIEQALSLLTIAVEIMPDDPHVLGIRGVVAALAGEEDAALVLLENAYVWNTESALVNYNLGNLLVQSSRGADWIRGKYLLLEAMKCGDRDISARAGLTLLANRNIPLLPAEAEAVYAQLEDQSVLSADTLDLPEGTRELVHSRMRELRESSGTVVKSHDKSHGELASLTMDEARAGDNFESLKQLGMVALDEGNADEAYDALYTSFLAGVPFDQDELDRLLPLSKEQGTLLETVRIAEARARHAGDDPHKLGDFYYYRFLARENSQRTLDASRALMAAYPDDPKARMVLMLGMLINGKAPDAIEILDENPVDLTVPDIRFRLVYACVLAANGQSVVADGIRESIPVAELLPAEVDLLKAY